MGETTRIDWCDSTWNPVTGCLHGCEYCYARRIAQRFGGYDGYGDESDFELNEHGGADDLKEIIRPMYRYNKMGMPVTAAYPFGFTPTLYRYRLDDPRYWKKPRTIFVCSMADLFGAWVEDAWIEAVMDACYAAPQHRYIFLTKNPERYDEVIEYIETDIKAEPGAELPDVWFGTSATTNKQLERAYRTQASWLSIEPILEPLAAEEYFWESHNYGFGSHEIGRWQWVVIGVETGNRKDKVVPKKEWIMEIVKECEHWKTPVFMKESLRGLMGPDFRQEFPWEVDVK